MNKVLVLLALLSTGLILVGCAPSLTKADNTKIVNSSSIETDNLEVEGSSPTKIATVNEAITWNKSDTETRDQQAKPDLSGSWVLNKELSDNLQEKIKENRQQAGNSRGRKSMGSGRGGGRGGGKGSGGRRGDGMKNSDPSGNSSGGKQKSMPQELRTLLKASETLELKHKEPMLTIITEDDQRQRVYTDFRGGSISSSGDMHQKIVIAGWESDVLVVETTMDSGRFIQRYNLIVASRQLWVSTIIQTAGLPKPVQFNRVYEHER